MLVVLSRHGRLRARIGRGLVKMQEGTIAHGPLARHLVVALVCAAAGCNGASRPVQPCVAREADVEIAVSFVEHADMLFVISDAPSMADDQAALQARLPALMRTLVSGEIDGQPFIEPQQDLHVAVVSASLADADDFHRVPAGDAAGCAEQYPTFLRYHGPYFGPNRDDPGAFVADFACLTDVGTRSAAPNQPLEAALRALSDPQRTQGFLRNDPVKGLSLIQIVVVSDSDDCSLRSDVMPSQAPATTTACAGSDALQSVAHYVAGLKALRKGNEDLVQLNVIAGIPATNDAVSLDFSFDTAREAFYARVLDDPAMQTTPDPSRPDRLRPACTSASASAEPARRLVEAARAFGGSARVLSLCADDWRPAASLFNVAEILVDRAPLCSPSPLVRAPDGRVACNLYWDLPPPALAPEGTPTRCSERPYLVADGKPSRPGGQRCRMQQLAITSEAELAAVDPNGGGWYYDDFSDEVRRSCAASSRATFKFTQYAAPQSDITVSLQCFESRLLSSTAEDAGARDPAACGLPGFSPALHQYSRGSIGRACSPAFIPEGGFDDRETYLETGAADCPSDVCIVYHLRGDPRKGCVTTTNQICDPMKDKNCEPTKLCADPEEAANRIYCSYRCALPGANQAPCPTGFSCREVVPQGGAAFGGSYCVKDGMFE
jgi:hypothetical protein